MDGITDIRFMINTTQFEFFPFPSRSRTDELAELVAPLWRLRRRSDERVELRTRARLADLAECSDGTQRTALQLCGTLQILLDGVLGHRGSLHALLQWRRQIIQALSDSRRRDLCETEQHHMADDLHFVRIVRETGSDVT